MEVLHVRRHTYTKKGDDRGRGSHLSQEGVDLARHIAADLPAIDLVVVSAAARTLETALAMGFAVDDHIDYPDAMEGTTIDFHAWWEWDRPYVRLTEIVRDVREAARVGGLIADAWADVARRLTDERRALVVSHGGLMELGLVCAVPEGDHAGWGKPFAHLEGFDLAWDGSRFSGAALKRV